MNLLAIQIPKAFEPLFQPARYKAYFGGRGSAKSHSFATALVLLGVQKPLRILCGREIQKSIKDSVKRLIDDKIRLCGLEGFYTSTDTEVRGANGTLFIFAGLKTNIESIKSMEGIDIAWIEEASTLSQSSLDILIPTIRKEGSELWFSWNPDNELDAIDMMFRGANPPPNSVIKRVSFEDNPFFTDVLKQEADQLKTTNVQKYNHVWGGEYNTFKEGAYYSTQIADLISKNRITHVSHDPNTLVHCSFDLGISDCTSIWFAQFVGTEVHIIDFIESNGQPISWYAQELSTKGYNYAPLILPHDARAREKGTGKTVEEVLQELGFETTIAPNLHVADGIDAVRSFLPRCWFNSDATRAGLKKLQSYRENYDDKLRISRGPLHDNNSHAADSFRYLVTGSVDPRINQKRQQDMIDAATNYVNQLQQVAKPVNPLTRDSLLDRYKHVLKGNIQSF